MNRDDIRIKHLIGIYRDLPGFVSQEDFIYMMSNWYYFQNGKKYIHDNLGLDDIGKAIFFEQVVKDRIDNEHDVQPLIDRMVNEGVIKVVKSTKHRTYYSVETSY